MPTCRLCRRAWREGLSPGRLNQRRTGAFMALARVELASPAYEAGDLPFVLSATCETKRPAGFCSARKIQ